MTAGCYRLEMTSALLLALVLSDAAPPDASDRPPNIVFVIADDLGYGDLGCFGSTKIRTPNIDRIAERGARLTTHYAGSPVCAPSRCVLMTGLHPGHAEVRNNREMQPEGQWPLSADAVTLAERFGGHGYATGCFGKWGLGGPGTVGEPLAQGIDRFYGFNCQRIAHNYYPVSLWSDRDVVPLRNPAFSAYQTLPSDADANDPASYDRYRGPDYSADLIAEQAVAFIADHADEPFLLLHTSAIPHVALQAPDEAIGPAAERIADDPPYDGSGGYLPVHRPRATYAGMVERLDAHVGQLLDALDAAGIAHQTIVVFTSDNGPATPGFAGVDSDWFASRGRVDGQTLRGYKGSMHEGGIRVPCVVSGPMIAAGTTIDRRTGFEDWTPTLLELAGGADWSTGLQTAGSTGQTVDVDGVSFAPTLRGTPQSSRPPLYREFAGYGGQQAIWDGDWKAIRRGLSRRGTPADPPWQLFDLADDPGEQSDVAGEHPAVVERLDRLAGAMRDPAPLFPLRAIDGE